MRLSPVTRENAAMRLRALLKGGVAALVALGMFWAGTAAQTSAPSPTGTLKKRDETLKKLTATMNTPEGDAKIRSAIVESFDFREHSRISLGKYWKKRTKEEQTEFISVMQAWTQNRAIKKLLKRSDRTTYDGEEITGSRALVKTTVFYKGTKTYIDYKMKMEKGRWRIYDMIIDGASVALANRDAFYKKIKKTSYAELVRTLKEKTLETS